MDDLEDLQARVAAAQEKLRLNADAQRKYGLRLNDVVTIVEGSLARQQDEMKRLQDAAISLRLERDATRVAESQAKSLYEVALTRLNLLQTQNEQLRNMVMTLLNVIEGRESASALQPVLQRLESSVHEVAATAIDVSAETVPPEVAAATDAAALPEQHVDASADAEEIGDLDAGDMAAEEISSIAPDETVAAEEPAAETPTEIAADAAASDEVGSVAGDVSSVESKEDGAIDDAVFEELDDEDDAEEEATAEQEAVLPPVVQSDLAADNAETEAAAGTEMLDAVDEDVEADAAEDMPEDIGEMQMNGHRDVVTDADEMLANEALDAIALRATAEEAMTPSSLKVHAVANGQQDETLVTALLDAEKALIEAGASGVANANSPVAEIIRRISLRTREFSEASSN
jgi:hypothetical protein